MPDLWERQTQPEGGEPTRAFAAFSLYRDLGPHRSLDKVAASLAAGRMLQKGALKAAPEGGTGGRVVPRYIQEWSRVWKWVSRADAWDQEQDRVKRRAMADEIVEMGKRQAQQAQAAAHVLTMPFIAINNRLKAVKGTEAALELEKLSFVDLLKLSASSAMFLRSMQQAERDARGVDSMASGGFSRAGEREQEAAPQVTVTGAEFTWVQGRCTCGHTHSAHDQTDANPMLVPCTIEKCGCQRYRDADEVEANA